MPTGIEDFAAQLRELKERSGRSYGTLAARLHVSTSTLHRYCNGAAVPGEYAPVERFARVCGATPEELVTLHRRWLLADAERRAPTSTPAPEPASAPEPEAQPGPGLAPVEAAEPDGLPTRPPRPGRRPRRTRAVLAGVAAVAVLVPLVLRTVGGASHDQPVSASLPGRGAATSSAPVASTNAPGSPSASATPSAGLSPSPTGSLGPSPSPSTRPSPDTGPPPFQVNVLSDNWDSQCGQWFLLGQPPAKVPPPPSLQQTNAWAAALGGIPAEDLRLQVTVQGTSARPVVLHALYVRIVSSRPAPKRIGYTPASGCGAGLDPANFAVDLDSPAPRAKPVAGLVGSGLTATLSNFPYQVSATDPQVIDVDAHTTDQDVSWYLELVWSQGSRQDVARIDDNGKPFRTVGLKGLPAYFYDGTTWARAEPQS
ncbi:helix-turn-helix domain-containing protein [Streptacidiphilus rugosus]|uniref:helix-turn-helix domain-containing protein n=1 Tax=Streptacidiphilus rugosus TaxID=405783 RepID=UPI0005612005|nr:helix-turn-helix transcriptional regulator [Streptacidiphilus rugosus]